MQQQETNKEYIPLVTWNNELEKRYVCLRDQKTKWSRDQQNEMCMLLGLRDFWVAAQIKEKRELEGKHS